LTWLQQLHLSFHLHGDCITFIVGGPWISNHFFPVVIVKTTDGLPGAVLDSYKGDYDIRLTKNCQYSKKERTDLLGLLQAFLVINDHILLPEYSIQDRRKIIEGLEFHFPTAYSQPSSSNACWLYSIAEKPRENGSENRFLLRVRSAAKRECEP